LGLRLRDLERQPVHPDDAHLCAGLERLALGDRAPDLARDHHLSLWPEPLAHGGRAAPEALDAGPRRPAQPPHPPAHPPPPPAPTPNLETPAVPVRIDPMIHHDTRQPPSGASKGISEPSAIETMPPMARTP